MLNDLMVMKYILIALALVHLSTPTFGSDKAAPEKNSASDKKEAGKRALSKEQDKKPNANIDNLFLNADSVWYGKLSQPSLTNVNSTESGPAR